MSRRRARVVILGGGFAGAYTAKHLEKYLKRGDDFEIALVNRTNYFVFQPLLSEVVSGSVDLTDTVAALRRLLPRTDLYMREIRAVDLVNRRVILRGGLFGDEFNLEYEHLVFALGLNTDFRRMPGLPEHALAFKDLADAVRLHNHLIRVMEDADTERDPERVRQLLTFVVAGGGFSGVEVVSVLNDFVRTSVRNYRDIDPDLIRVLLVHSGERVLDREFGDKLSRYAGRIMQESGVELVLNRRLHAATAEQAILDNGERIATRTLVSTVPASASPIIEPLDLPKDRNRLKVDRTLQVEGCDNLWALGDCALVPSHLDQGFAPPTAQHAVREARVAAHNIAAAMRGGTKKHFSFTGLGKLGLVGHRKAVAELFNRIRLSGFPAYFMWRSVYWWKLPGLDRKVNVGLSWALDLIMPPDMVELDIAPPRSVERLHFEPGDVVFRTGHAAGCLYLILDGQAEVSQESNGNEKALAKLGAGEFFGVSALVDGAAQPETVRCVQPMDVLCLNRRDLAELIAKLPGLTENIKQNVARRAAEGRPASGQGDNSAPKK